MSAAIALLAVTQLDAQPVVHRRALLVGINDYSASHLAAVRGATPAPNRDWPNLTGAVNDVSGMREMLVAVYGFGRNDIVSLTDQEATRDAILRAIEEKLVNPAAKGDVVLFYFAGHGSQVRNSLSEERDKLDESLVPADSRIGADDIRDKELRKLFNRILDRGARLTVILDNCHSASGARGLGTGARPRGVKPDLRDVADRVNSPPPEDRGALVLAAAEDFDTAWETRDADGNFHGAFSWAWMRAMRDACSGEPAMETFLRAQARLRAETPYQEPVIAGNADARLSPFLGPRTDPRDDRIVAALERIRRDGTIAIQGGWANGLSVGTELRDPASNARLTITALRGMSESEARMQSSGNATPRSGALLEVVAWAAPPGQPLRVWMPRARDGTKDIASMARSLSAEAAQHGVRWMTDPTDATPAHLLRWNGDEWELLSNGNTIEHLGQNAAAIAAVARLAPGATLFVQFPAPAALVIAIAVEGVEQVTHPEEADYVLAGRYVGRHLSFAWVRPSVKKSDRRKTGLPRRSAWIAERRNDNRLRDTAPSLHEALLRLRKIHAWYVLESPPADRFPYVLAARRARDGALAKDNAIIGGEKYELVMRVTALPFPAKVPQRYVYAFAIDSYGKTMLLFPQHGSVENRFPQSPPPAEIALGDEGAFEASPPYGVDTYFLLSTDEPLPNPWILEADGVRGAQPQTPLEKLLMQTSAGTRSITLVTPSRWSIARTTYESLAPHATKTAR